MSAEHFTLSPEAASRLAPHWRGVLLLALHAQYPLPLLRRALAQQCVELFPADHFARTLAYLAERHLVEINAATVAGIEVVTVKITTTGVDLVERRSTDPAIALGDR